jgi:hypothetical protein
VVHVNHKLTGNLGGKNARRRLSFRCLHTSSAKVALTGKRVYVYMAGWLAAVVEQLFLTCDGGPSGSPRGIITHSIFFGKRNLTIWTHEKLEDPSCILKNNIPIDTEPINGKGSLSRSNVLSG